MLRKSLKNIAGVYRTVLVNAIRHWQRVLLTVLVVTGLLTLGLLLKPRFTAVAIVEIGGVLEEGGVGIVRLQHYENASDVENFFSREALTQTGNAFSPHCNAKAYNTPSGLQLHINCSGHSYQQVRNMSMSALRPILIRHARAYDTAKAIHEQRIVSMERELQKLERVTGSLRKYLDPQPIEKGVNGSLEMNLESHLKVIDYQLKIENLREKLAVERIMGNRVKQTKLGAKGINVTDRNPGPGIWAMVAAMALLSGLFVAGFSATLKQVEHE